MKRVILLVLLCNALIKNAAAQVEDVSVVVAPTLGYNWFDSKSTIDNGWMYGIQAGFGFGRFLELRGIYERSLDLKQQFGKYEGDLQQYFPDLNLSNRDVKVTRVGGEFKANISPTGLSPYLILGTGVQTFERTLADNEVYKSKYLYGTGGLGIKINIGDRATLNLEGRGISYKMNPGSLLYNPGGSSEFDDWVDNQERTRMFNWSASAGLQFYLGGRRSTELSAMDREYLNRFSGGMSGTKLTLAPAGAYVRFNSASPYRSTYMAGGIVGLDITNYVGLRGYYYQATADKNPSLNFDKLAMYGADFIGKLNVPRGIVPFITIGGGYLKVQNGYEGKAIEEVPGTFQIANSGYFAKGGVGVEVPMGRNLDVFGAANLLYMVDDADTKITDLRTTDQLQQHTMYNVGIRLKFGSRANTTQATNDAFESRYADERRRYAAERDARNQRMQELEAELKEAYSNNDVQKATKVIEEKKSIEARSSGMPDKGGSELVRLTPAELERLVEKAIENADNKYDSAQQLEKRLDRLEQLLLNLNRSDRNVTEAPVTYGTGTHTADLNDKLLAEIAKLNQQLEEQKRSTEALKQQIQVPATAVPPPATLSDEKNNQNDVDVVEIRHNRTGYNQHKGIGAFAGVNVGEGTAFNIGIRSYYGLGRSPLLFMPELYVALGDKTGAGLSGNIVFPFNLRYNSRFSPYVGAGVGLHGIAGVTRFNTNVLAGTTYQLGRGSAFADYSVRGAFRNNQVAVGYRFKF